MKIKFFAILICLLLIIHGNSYAQDFDSKKISNASSSHHDDRAMGDLFQYDNRLAEAKSLSEKKQVDFDGISNYFENNAKIKSFRFALTGDSITYTGQINENEYEQLRNNLDHISMDSDFFNWGIRVSYWRDIINNKMHVTIYDPTLLKESDGYWCSEYFIYDKDDLDEKEADTSNETTWQKRDRLNSNWYFEQRIQKVSFANNSSLKWRNKVNKISINEWTKERSLLSFNRVREIFRKQSNEFNKFAEILMEKNKYFSYSHFLNFKDIEEGERYKNFNEFTFYNREQIENITDGNPNKREYAVYCKRVEDFIRLLEANDLVLSAGISVDCEDLRDGKSRLKIFTRTKAKDDQCLNVTIMYDETGTIRESDKSVKELMPGWYYKSGIGKIQGLNAAE